MTSTKVYKGKRAIIPLAHISHVETNHDTPRHEGWLTVVMKSTSWNEDSNYHSNSVSIAPEQAEEFMAQWIAYIEAQA
jgi:hypothetical protein